MQTGYYRIEKLNNINIINIIFIIRRKIIGMIIDMDRDTLPFSRFPLTTKGGRRFQGMLPRITQLF